MAKRVREAERPVPEAPVARSLSGVSKLELHDPDLEKAARELAQKERFLEKLEQGIVEREVESRLLHALETSDDLMRCLQEKTPHLADLRSRMTPEAFEQDRPGLEAIVKEFIRTNADIETLLISLRARVQIEHPELPPLRRAILWLLKIFWAQAYTMRQVRSQYQRVAYLQAAQEFEELTKDEIKIYWKRIQGVYKLQVELRRDELLAKDTKYQKLLNDFQEVTVARESISFSNEDNGGGWRAEPHELLFCRMARKWLLEPSEAAVFPPARTLWFELTCKLDSLQKSFKDQIGAAQKRAYDQAIEELNVPPNFLK